MRISEFWALADSVFGESYSRTLARELALDGCRSMTAAESLAQGVPARDVWHALCDQMSIPLSERDGGERTTMVPPPRQ
ncbi:DUF3046 domain-containing protein [Demequina sediminicola]|uniref:DUF3046 domain-containing protein n=1 Tax=Demequina sediminicola TaxID=1095026 RepID=UPI0007861CB2|nr:DUF3046 domain-containing protein [Demequina sediminicola]